MRRSLKINRQLETGTALPKLNATGILLAGGKSSRMKRDKAFLELQGKSLAERSIEVLKAVFSEVLISSNKPELFTSFALPVIQDETPNRGPLEGLYQGLRAARYDEVFFVACDMPFLDEKLIRYLAAWSPDYDVVVPKLESGLHPLHAFYHRRCLAVIKNNLEAGLLKIMDIYSSCSVKFVSEAELAEFSKLENAFCNVNTPKEWADINQA